jgi:hypothetical protein
MSSPVPADLRRNRAGILMNATITAVDRAGVVLGTRLRSEPHYATATNSRGQVYRLSLNDGVAVLDRVNITMWEANFFGPCESKRMTV